MKYLLLSITFVLYVCITCVAQKSLNSNYIGSECGTDEIHNSRMATDSVYRAEMLKMESQIKAIIDGNTFQNAKLPVYDIPVVVHVIEDGVFSISDATIISAIAGLNDRWRNIIGTGVDMEIQFCLATRDPNCNSTTGINRVSGAGVTNYVTNGMYHSSANPTGADATDIKNLSIWPHLDYYNIWVVNDIGTVAGYASYPSMNTDEGTVMDENYMNSNSNTLTHELGHAHYLYHTFNGDGTGSTCPTDIDCTIDGDRVCDTEPHKRDDGCSGTNSCTGGSLNLIAPNYLSYCGSSRTEFIQGQKDRVRAQYLLNPRASLLNSEGCSLPVVPTSNMTFAAACVGETVDYIDNSSDCPTSWNWTFPEGSPATSTSQSPSVTYASPGFHDVSLTTSNGIGQGDTANQVINIYNTPTPAACAVQSTNLSNGFGIGIWNCTLNTINNSTGGTVLDSGYQDFTCAYVADLDLSTLYNIYVTVGSFNNEWVRAYIDYNNDGSFNETNELVWVSDTATDLHSGSFTTSSSPMTATLLRMRVMSGFYAISNSCDAPTYGQTEDYGVIFNVPPAADFVPSATNNCIGDTIIFTDISSGSISSWSWDFGIGASPATATGQGPHSVAYSNAGGKDVTLMLSGPLGSDTIVKSAVVIINQPIVSLGPDTTVCGGLTLDAGSGFSSYLWSNGFTGQSQFIDTSMAIAVIVQDGFGCTSEEDTVIVLVNPTYTTNVASSICDNDSIFLQGAYQNTASDYYDTLATVDACDSVIVTALTVFQTYSISSSMSICASDSIYLEGAYQNTSATYVDTLASVAACDSVVTTVLSVTPEYRIAATASICSYDSIYLQGAYQNTAGTYDDSALTVAGCDSVIMTTLTVNNAPATPTISVSGATDFCQGDSVVLTSSVATGILWSDGSTTTQSLTVNTTGSFNVAVTDTNGCSATSADVVVSVNAIFATSVNASICANDSIYLAGSFRKIAGTYFDTLLSVNSCDSIITTALSIVSDSLSLSTSICSDDSIYLEGAFQNSTGTYIDIYTSASGCDSTVTTDLVVNAIPAIPTITASGSTTFCEGDSITLTCTNATSYLWSTLEITQSIVVSGSGPITVLVTDGNGCSATSSEIILTTLPPKNTSENTEICEGDSLLIGGSFQNSSGVYDDTLSTAMGCDSIISTILTVNTLPTVTFSGLDTGFCTTNGPVTLVGSPSGGTFTGTGVSGTQFIASIAGAGLHYITYTFTDANNCTSEDLQSVFVFVCEGLGELAKTIGLKVYPNPFSGSVMLRIEGIEFGEYVIKIYDILGRETCMSRTTLKEVSIGAELNAGLYYINVWDDHKQIGTTQIIKR